MLSYFEWYSDHKTPRLIGNAIYTIIQLFFNFYLDYNNKIS